MFAHIGVRLGTTNTLAINVTNVFAVIEQAGSVQVLVLLPPGNIDTVKGYDVNGPFELVNGQISNAKEKMGLPALLELKQPGKNGKAIAFAVKHVHAVTSDTDNSSRILVGNPRDLVWYAVTTSIDRVVFMLRHAYMRNKFYACNER